jgi:hypothetical protein
MSTIFPELERQLEHAAERGGRLVWGGVRWAVPAIAVVAVVAVALVVAMPEGSDERPATGTAGTGAANALSSAYGIFGPSGRAPDPVTERKLATKAGFAEQPPPTFRLAGAAGNERVVVAAGRLEVDGASAVCLYDVEPAGVGSVCMSQDALLSTGVPWVLNPGRTTVILVRDDVTNLRLHLADGTVRDLVPHDNVAFGRGEKACTIEWQRVDGSHDGAPVGGAPSEGCG